MKKKRKEPQDKNLTAKEKEYLEWWIQAQNIRPWKRIMIVVWSIFGVVFCLLFILIPVLEAQGFIGGTSESFKGMIGLWAMFLGMVAFLVYITIKSKKQMKRLKAYDYTVYRRTKIIKKDILRCYVRGGVTMKTPYYLCEGVTGKVSPLSKKFFDAVKPRDDVTVVLIEELSAYVGITFPERQG